MKASILIGNYNNREFIDKTLKSCLNQNFNDYEIIVVDDCSTDGSYEYLLNTYSKNPLIRLYRNNQNKGPSFTYNRCIEESKGEFLFFLGCDDLISKNYLRQIVQLFERSDYDIILNSPLKINAEDQIVGGWVNTKGINCGDYITFLQYGAFFWENGLGIRKQKMGKVRYIENSLADGFLFIYRILKKSAGKFFILDENLVSWRQHDTSLTKSRTYECFQDVLFGDIVLYLTNFKYRTYLFNSIEVRIEILQNLGSRFKIKLLSEILAKVKWSRNLLIPFALWFFLILNPTKLIWIKRM